MSRGWSQTLFSGAQRQGKKVHEEELLYFEGNGALEQAAQRSCGVSFYGDIQNPAG